MTFLRNKTFFELHNLEMNFMVRNQSLILNVIYRMKRKAVYHTMHDLFIPKCQNPI